jgi:hypothetical protein
MKIKAKTKKAAQEWLATSLDADMIRSALRRTWEVIGGDVMDVEGADEAAAPEVVLDANYLESYGAFGQSGGAAKRLKKINEIDAAIARFRALCDSPVTKGKCIGFDGYELRYAIATLVLNGGF